MVNGANAVHNKLRKELAKYIKSQYLGKSEILMDALGDRLEEEGVLYKKPYIESSPAYVTVPDGIEKSKLDNWEKVFFKQLSDANLGVFPSPFKHQIQALEAIKEGKDLFVSTGTGSGKTECFMWPLMLKLAKEAKMSADTWKQSYFLSGQVHLFPVLLLFQVWFQGLPENPVITPGQSRCQCFLSLTAPSVPE